MDEINYTERIIPEGRSIISYLEDLKNKKYQIPTFQRNIVWERNNVKKLWDSICKFYPMGSILIWKTPTKLQNHREIGGHIISDNENKNEYQYILDGQQRTTSLLTSIYGGQTNDIPDTTLYVDLTVVNKGPVDDHSYTNRFLFWDEIDKTKLTRNAERYEKYENGLIIKLLDIKSNFKKHYDNVSKNTSNNKNEIENNLWVLQKVLDNYKISFIELKDISVAEVCQIFERINQAGLPLNIFDIVVAKTYRTENKHKNIKSFYLRQIIEDFRKEQNVKGNNSRYLNLDNLTYLQILAVLIRDHVPENVISNITDKYLNEIKAEQIESVWDKAQTSILKTFDFLENHLNLKGPELIPFRYFYFTLVAYFYSNAKPDYELLKKYFWYNSLHSEDLLSNTTQLREHITFLNKFGKDENVFKRLLLNKEQLRTASYHSKSRISRAILALYVSKRPKDWENMEREVVATNFFFNTDYPNMHHIFPIDYISKNPGSNLINENSLMNIAFITQMTNLDISNKNPLNYFSKYIVKEFIKIMDSHYLPSVLLDWVQMEKMPTNALDVFIEERLEMILTDIKLKLSNLRVEIIDTKE